MNQNLPIYGIQGKIDQYRTPKKSKFINLAGGNRNGILPPDELRLYSEDIYKPSVRPKGGGGPQADSQQTTGLTDYEEEEKGTRGTGTSMAFDTRPTSESA